MAKLGRNPLFVILLGAVLLAVGCTGGDDDVTGEAATTSAPDELEPDDSSSSSTPTVSTSSSTTRPTSASSTSSTTQSTSGSSTSIATSSSPTITPTTSSPAPSGGPVVRVGAMAIERTEACTAVTVAATFNLVFDSGGSTLSIPDGQAEQVQVVEGESTWVAPGQSFIAETPDWELNVRMLEHLSGQTRGAIHTEPSELADTIMIGGTPVDILWQVTQDGTRVDLSEATFQIADSCVMFQPGVMLTFTDADGSQTVVGDISPVFEQAQNLPLNTSVVFFEGAEFETSSADGWTLAVNVVEHWNGRLHQVSHTAAGDMTATVATVSADDLAWEIQYAVDVSG